MTIDIKELIEELNDNEYNVRSYSGRGMYGSECLGITCGNPIETLVSIMEFLYESSRYNDGEPQFLDYTSLFMSGRTDSMGLSSILYFPKIKWPEGLELPDRDEDE
jgi:hypothetical protein